MNATFYYNKSDKKRLNKDLTTIATYGIVLKDNTELIEPTIIMSRAINTQTTNYVYIDTLQRYYYINNVEYSQNRYYISLMLDERMTYKEQIKALNVIANRSSSNFNVYQKDSQIPFLNKNIIATQPFPNGFGGQSLLLATSGG